MIKKQFPLSAGNFVAKVNELALLTWISTMPKLAEVIEVPRRPLWLCYFSNVIIGSFYAWSILLDIQMKWMASSPA